MKITIDTEKMRDDAKRMLDIEIEKAKKQMANAREAYNVYISYINDLERSMTNQRDPLARKQRGRFGKDEVEKHISAVTGMTGKEMRQYSAVAGIKFHTLRSWLKNRFGTYNHMVLGNKAARDLAEKNQKNKSTNPKQRGRRVSTQRMVFDEFKKGNFTVSEIADAIGKSRTSVSSAIHRLKSYGKLVTATTRMDGANTVHVYRLARPPEFEIKQEEQK